MTRRMVTCRSKRDMLLTWLLLALLGWTGARCEVDVDECASGAVSCGPGDCLNLDGSYTCQCTAGFCGNECALRDPCLEPAAAAGGGETGEAGEGGDGGNSTGPCLHGGRCEQRCTATTDYVCHCTAGWTGKNCSYQGAWAGAEGEAAGGGGGGGGGGRGWGAAAAGAGGALAALLVLGGALAALGAQARRKRATRGTYSPSGQEYCNPRAEMITHALKPPPEERLI